MRYKIKGDMAYVYCIMPYRLKRQFFTMCLYYAQKKIAKVFGLSSIGLKNISAYVY